ncbi:MAG: hypothetical protein FJ117_05775 [Deltaproteobacteria bacterium]|nr:hypothetical protein [Deltaproteobacteria bacterium]
MVRESFEGGQLKFLSPEEIERIHQTSLKILEEGGVKVPLSEAMEVYRKGGARIGPDDQVVKIPAKMVEEALKTAPPRILLCGRDPANDLILENRKVYAGTGGAEIHTLDLETKKLRMATLKDVADLARLVDGLRYIDFYIRPVEAQDVPLEKLDINKYYASLVNTGKHVMGNVYFPEKVKEVMSLGAMIAGSEKELRQRPILSFITSWMLSPLTLNPDVTRILLEIVKQRMPVALSSVAILGFSSPVTLAGNLTPYGFRRNVTQEDGSCIFSFH